MIGVDVKKNVTYPLRYSNKLRQMFDDVAIRMKKNIDCVTISGHVLDSAKEVVGLSGLQIENDNRKLKKKSTTNHVGEIIRVTEIVDRIGMCSKIDSVQEKKTGRFIIGYC